MDIAKKQISLTIGQQEALARMFDWNKTHKIDSKFTLIGSAGTGKSTVIGYFIPQCGIPKNKIAVSAPTHKAKTVITKFTGLEGFTLQALIGLRPDTELENFDINNPMFAPISEPRIALFDLVVIDECSMVNKALKEHLDRQSQIFGTKIIYLGDEKQLPPINEKISTTFTEVEHTFRLTEIVRQNNTNPLMEIINSLKESSP